MLDSGAFSAWNKGVSIDLDRYVAFVKDYSGFFESYVSLDVIAGSGGRQGDFSLVNKAAEEGWDNFCYMRNEGLDPIPVLHYGEDFEFLDRYLLDGSRYIGVGAVSHLSRPTRFKWLDKVFSYLCDEDGWPIVKIHLFGVNSVDVFEHYPFFTSDSATFQIAAGTGSIFIPKLKLDLDSDYDYSRPPYIIRMTDYEGHTTKNLDYRALLSKGGDAEPAYVERYLESIGLPIDKVSKSYFKRAQVNVYFIKKVVERAKVIPFKIKSRDIFGFSQTGSVRQQAVKLKGDKRFVKKRMLFSVSRVNGKYSYSKVLTWCDASDRLISFPYIETLSYEDLDVYHKTGLIESLRSERK